eukprot:scaffold59863_cov58-Attheya_sp.AAC.1
MRSDALIDCVVWSASGVLHHIALSAPRKGAVVRMRWCRLVYKYKTRVQVPHAHPHLNRDASAKHEHELPFTAFFIVVIALIVDP